MIAIPVFNVELHLPALLPMLNPWKNDVLLIDDGSSDNTVEIIRSMGFSFFRRDSNIGLSGFYSTAMNHAAAAGYTHLIALDGDGQHDPAYIPDFIKALRHSDLVSGNRFSSPAGIPASKIASNLFARLLFRQYLGLNLPDVACGYRGVRISSLPKEIRYSRYEIIYGMLASHALAGKKTGFVAMPAIYHPDDPLLTKCSELEGLLTAIQKFRPSHELAALMQSVLSRKNFRIQLGKHEFHAGFSAPGSYLFETDQAKAIAYMNENP